MMLFLVDDVLLYNRYLLNRVGERGQAYRRCGTVWRDGGNAAISAENDMVNEIGITHNEATVAIISGLNTWSPQLGSPPATISVIFYPQ